MLQIGARSYFLANILHNWPTSICRLILRNLKAAMIVGYSKLLISEVLLPRTNCPLALAGLDFAMMFWHAGMERSEEEWRKLLRSEDLQITNIWHNPAGDGTIIEAMVSDTLLKDVVESHYHCRMFSI